MDNEVIDNLIARPAMYFGERQGYLREVVAMDLGYSIHAGFDEERMDFKETLIPRAFVNLVCSRFEMVGTDNSAWSARIDARSGGEVEAWQLFCALWTEFRNMPISA